jgi:hypothetical protein
MMRMTIFTTFGKPWGRQAATPVTMTLIGHREDLASACRRSVLRLMPCDDGGPRTWKRDESARSR